jgi:DNA polymerase III alpha subunit
MKREEIQLNQRFNRLIKKLPLKYLANETLDTVNKLKARLKKLLLTCIEQRRRDMPKHMITHFDGRFMASIDSSGELFLRVVQIRNEVSETDKGVPRTSVWTKPSEKPPEQPTVPTTEEDWV